MESDNVKLLWKSIQDKESKEYLAKKINIADIIKKEHCNVLAKMLHDAMKGLIVNSVLLAIWIGLLLYAYIYLNLHFSLITNLMFGVIFSFLLFSFLLGVNKYYLLRKEDYTSTIKESFLSFRKRMLRADMLYISVLTVYFYLLMARMVFVLMDNFKSICQSGMFFPIIFIILMIAGIPWLIKIESKHRYRKLFKILEKTMYALENELK